MGLTATAATAACMLATLALVSHLGMVAAASISETKAEAAEAGAWLGLPASGVALEDVAAYVDYWSSTEGHSRLHPEPATCTGSASRAHAAHAARGHGPQRRRFRHHDTQRPPMHGQEELTDMCTCEQIDAWRESASRRRFHEALPAAQKAHCIAPPELPAHMYSFCPTSFFMKGKNELDAVRAPPCTRHGTAMHARFSRVPGQTTTQCS